MVHEEDFKEGYILGFIEAEGSFSVSIKFQRDVFGGVRLDPVFSITQKNREVLEAIKEHLGIGRIMEKAGQPNTYVYVVDNFNELVKLINFLNKYADFMIVKKRQFLMFREIANGLVNGEHLHINGLKRLVKLAYELTKESEKGYRKYDLNHVLSIIDKWDLGRNVSTSL
uniref:RRNA intron-encoded endonuclease n=1 Tax=Vulcanisaeta distributa TaxID=164451 RepID=UPI00018A86E4|nr:Chain A, RRNA intron-encoded endonuclease [Vulcanisaeta distributa]3E54_B Chain B, RRNA intron-encoded endonuclease [Vulcanisaeta distributa]